MYLLYTISNEIIFQDRELCYLIREDRKLKAAGIRKRFQIRGQQVTVEDAEKHFRRKNIVPSDEFISRHCSSPAPSILDLTSVDLNNRDGKLSKRTYARIDRAMKPVSILPQPDESMMVDHRNCKADTSEKSSSLNVPEPTFFRFSGHKDEPKSSKRVDSHEQLIPLRLYYVPDKQLDECVADHASSPDNRNGKLRRQSSRFRGWADVTTRSSRFECQMPIHNIGAQFIPRSLLACDEQYKSETLLFAMSVLCESELGDSIPSQHEGYGYETCSRLIYQLQLINEQMRIGQTDKAEENYDLALQVFHKGRANGERWLCRFICWLLTHINYSADHDFYRDHSSVYKLFTSYMSRWSMIVNPKHPLGQLSMVFSGNIVFQQNLGPKILEIFVSRLKDRVSTDNLAQKAILCWKLALLDSGLDHDLERRVLLDISNRELALQSSPRNQAELVEDQGHDIFILIRYCERRRDGPQMLTWCRKLLALPSCTLVWSAKAHSVYGYIWIGDFDRALAEATECLRYAVKAWGAESSQALYSQDLLLQVQTGGVQTMQCRHQWCATS